MTYNPSEIGMNYRIRFYGTGYAVVNSYGIWVAEYPLHKYSNSIAAAYNNALLDAVQRNAADLAPPDGAESQLEGRP